MFLLSHCAVIRSVVEYASPLFLDLPAFLCCALERMQKRVLSIILPGVSYQEALCQSGLAPLEARRAELCVNFMKSVKSGNPLLPICEGLLVNNESKYDLRHQLQHKVIVNANRFKDFVTFRYAHTIRVFFFCSFFNLIYLQYKHLHYLRYLQCHTILTLLTIQTLTLRLLLIMPYHSYIANNTNNTSNIYTYNTNTNYFVCFQKKKREGKPALLLSVI